MPDEMIDQAKLRPPIIGEAPQVRDDERDIGIFAGQQFTHPNLAHHVIKDGQTISPRRLTDLPRDPRVIAVDLNPHEPMLLDRFAHQLQYSPTVALRMDKREA